MRLLNFMQRCLLPAMLSFFLLGTAKAENYLQIVTLKNTQGAAATFESKGIHSEKKQVIGNATRSVFYTLFYVGVEGVNNGQPLVVNEKKAYTDQFISDNGDYCMYYVVDRVELSAPKKEGGKYRGNYAIQINLKKLLSDLEKNGIFQSSNAGSKDNVAAEDVRSADNLITPTVIVVPYKKEGESYSAILQSDADRRIAVARVQDGFESRNITTVDLEAKISAVQRRNAYEKNSGAADSNDKQLLLTSGADVYVTVDINKETTAAGSRVSLSMKAYETASGSVLASKVATPVRYYQTTATDALCNYAISDALQPFLDDICKNFRPASGTKVVLQFAIDGSSSATMNDPMGKNNYSFSNIVRQWVRKNSYQGKYHLQGVMDESMIFDYVTIPPKDEDGLRMDAAQFAFLLEQYLKETEGISCSSRVDGNNILFTIF
ncbi:MAG: hypothetical protein J6W47_07405 [Bacteroidales bacterium]|nr:hypothetical protein [Bacteroidales bacterium]MBP5764925.1 hypothetical protein [Bacteroidales bacterium]